MEWLRALKGLVKARINTIIQLKAHLRVENKKNSNNQKTEITFNNNGTMNVFQITPGKMAELMIRS